MRANVILVSISNNQYWNPSLTIKKITPLKLPDWKDDYGRMFGAISKLEFWSRFWVKPSLWLEFSLAPRASFSYRLKVVLYFREVDSSFWLCQFCSLEGWMTIGVPFKRDGPKERDPLISNWFYSTDTWHTISLDIRPMSNSWNSDKTNFDLIICNQIQNVEEIFSYKLFYIWKWKTLNKLMTEWEPRIFIINGYLETRFTCYFKWHVKPYTFMPWSISFMRTKGRWPPWGELMCGQPWTAKCKTRNCK